jgi:hypothetical protein
MHWRILALAGAGVATVLSTSLVTSQLAEARSRCVYMAHDPQGRMMADGWATASKMSRACDRARRRCNRELERKRRQGRAGRGSCRRISNL